MNTEFTEQPFNLETALKHPEWVRTRDGREIDFIKDYPKRANGTNVVFITKDGWTYSADTDGTWHQNLKTNNDLILRVPYVEKWINIFEEDCFDNKKDADYMAECAVKPRLACVPVKIPAI